VIPRTLILTALLALTGTTQAALSWSSQLPPNPHADHAGHGGHGGRGAGTPFILRDGDGATAQLRLPTLVRRALEPDAQGLVTLQPSGLLSYHLLLATRSSPGREEVALRYHYLNGKPSDASPSLLVNSRKATLDIIPAPLTREHQRYQANGAYHYLLRYGDLPLANTEVRLTTSNGSVLSTTSDHRGRLSFTLPDDFPEVQAGRGANRPAEFLLSATHTQAGTQHLTTLSADYHADPAHWRSALGGWLALLGGFVGGLAVVQFSRNSSEENARD